jgi:hypothetical protein
MSDDDDLVEQSALVAVGQHHALADGAGQGHREESGRGAGHHRDGLSFVEEV